LREIVYIEDLTLKKPAPRDSI